MRTRRKSYNCCAGLLGLLLVLPTGLQAQFTFTTNNGTIAITGYVGGGGPVLIPGEINGLPVTGIGGYAFYAHTGMTGITIPNSITSIGASAFLGCTSLTNVSIPESVASIGHAAFASCPNLTAIEVDPQNSSYSSADGVLFNKGQTTLVQCPQGKTGSYTIPDSVTSIGYAFSYCTNLTSVTIGHGLAGIGEYAFDNCISLTSVTIPDGVVYIGDYAFRRCVSLASVVIPRSLASIGFGVFNECIGLGHVTFSEGITNIPVFIFENCTGLTTVVIPNSVSTIEPGAFFGCSSLSSVAFSTNLVNIGADAFHGCTSLGNVTIPASVFTIGGGAFADCSNLGAINVDSLNYFYSSGEGVLFNKNRTTLLQCPGAKAGVYVIPTNVTSIGALAFAYCTNLTSVALGTNITTMGLAAFSGCSGLRSIAIPNSIHSIAENQFAYCTSLTNIAIPDSVNAIAHGAFAYCTSLPVVTIPASVNSIGLYAFGACASLASIVVDSQNSSFSSVDGVLFDKSQSSLIQFPAGKSDVSYTIQNGVSTIAGAAFGGCRNLTSVDVGSSVTLIDDSFAGCIGLTNLTIGVAVADIGVLAFAYCTNLNTFSVNALNPHYSSIDGVLFDREKTTLVRCPGARTNYTVPDGVTTIGFEAFSYCSRLTRVTFPASVTNLGFYAFIYCPSPKEVYFLGDAPADDSTVYYNYPYDENYAATFYLPGKAGWASNFGGYPARLWRPEIRGGDSVGIQTNHFGFGINWASGMNVIVEASTDLRSPNWSPVGTNTLVDGISYFSDPEWTNHPARFYRIRSE